MNKPAPLFDFIERDPDNPAAFWINHEEIGGRARFLIKKPTFGTRSQFHQVKSLYIGTSSPTPELEAMADYAATFDVCFEISPFTSVDNNPAVLDFNEIIDFRLIRAASSEVGAYWQSFRVDN